MSNILKGFTEKVLEGVLRVSLTKFKRVIRFYQANFGNIKKVA